MFKAITQLFGAKLDPSDACKWCSGPLEPMGERRLAPIPVCGSCVDRTKQFRGVEDHPRGWGALFKDFPAETKQWLKRASSPSTPRDLAEAQGLGLMDLLAMQQKLFKARRDGNEAEYEKLMGLVRAQQALIDQYTKELPGLAAALESDR